MGETFISPVASVVLTAGQKVNIAAITPLPAGVAAAKWYFSKAPDDQELAFIIQNTGAAFIINVLPDDEAGLVSVTNTAGEEVIRVQASFTQENIRMGKFRWPLTGQSSINQVLIKYREASEDFAERELYVNDYAHQRLIKKVNKVEIDGSGIDNYNQASRIANSRLSKEREGNFLCEWDTDEAGMAFEEGDVVCASDVTGGFVNLPLRIESIRIHDNLDVTFLGRLYSTVMYSDATGQHPITLPSTLKYLNQPPPAVSNVVLIEGSVITANDTWISTIIGTFDFGEFASSQLARIYIKYETDTDYRLVDTVLPTPDNTGLFEILAVPITTGSGHLVKIVTESQFGYTLGLTAATAYPVLIVGPPPITAPSPFVGYFDLVDGDNLQSRDGTPASSSLIRETYELQQLAADGTTVIRTQIIDPLLNSILPDAIIWTVTDDFTRQTEYNQVVGTISGSGDATVVVIAAGMTSRL